MRTIKIVYLDGTEETQTCESAEVTDGILKLWGRGGYSARRDLVAIPLTSVRRYEITRA